MSFPGPNVGGGDVGGANIGGADLQRSTGPLVDFVVILAPPDMVTVVEDTPWTVSGSGPTQIRIDAELWADGSSGIMSDLAGWAGLAAGAEFSFQARLTDDTGITSAITLTKGIAGGLEDEDGEYLTDENDVILTD